MQQLFTHLVFKYTANDLINIKHKISHWNEANKVKFFEEKQEKD